MIIRSFGTHDEVSKNQEIASWYQLIQKRNEGDFYALRNSFWNVKSKFRSSLSTVHLLTRRSPSSYDVFITLSPRKIESSSHNQAVTCIRPTRLWSLFLYNSRSRQSVPESLNQFTLPPVPCNTAYLLQFGRPLKLSWSKRNLAERYRNDPWIMV